MAKDAGFCVGPFCQNSGRRHAGGGGLRQSFTGTNASPGMAVRGPKHETTKPKGALRLFGNAILVNTARVGAYV